MSDILQDYEVFINGHKVPFLLSFTWDVSPRPIREDINTIEDPYTRYATIKESYAEGSLRCKARINEYSNTPLDVMDILGFNNVSSYYDTTTGRVVHSSTSYDAGDEEGEEYGVPQIPIETRQVNVTGDQAISSGGTYTKIAIGFIATGEEMELARVWLREAVASTITQCQMEVWSDSSGPSAKLVGSNTITPTIDPGDGASYVNGQFVTVDFGTYDILGTARLTVGEKYWLVLIATDSDSLYVGYTKNDRYSDGGLYTYSGSWAAHGTGLHGTFIVQCFQTYGGYTIDVYQYISGHSRYIWYRCRACDLHVLPPEISGNVTTSIGIKFKSEDVSATKSV